MTHVTDDLKADLDSPMRYVAEASQERPWTPWNGKGDCPVKPGTVGEAKLRNGMLLPETTLSVLRWSHYSPPNGGDIIAYRLAEDEPAKPVANEAKGEEGALAEFTAYFVRNYPGPDTIIHDPRWHAPRIFRAARAALGAPPADGTETVAKPLGVQREPSALYQDSEELLCECGAAGSGLGHTDWCPWLHSEWFRWGEAYERSAALSGDEPAEPVASEAKGLSHGYSFDGESYGAVQCHADDCGAYVVARDGTEAEAIAAWNARAALDSSLRRAVIDAIDFLAERKYGNSARSPGHNARVILEAALGASPADVEEAETRRQFKNFHRMLCERFDYTHDEKDWVRDQVSLMEHIAALRPAETGEAVAWQAYLPGNAGENSVTRLVRFRHQADALASEGWTIKPLGYLRPSTEAARIAELEKEVERLTGELQQSIAIERLQAERAERVEAAISGGRVLADIAVERQRQIDVKGFATYDDDEYTNGEMAAAAACYAFTGARSPHEITNRIWPWSLDWWKPTTPRRNLVKAGALIVAEIERLDRLAAAPVPSVEAGR